jgi:hypothetical protein
MIASKLLRGAAAGIAATVTMSGVLLLAKKTGMLGEPPPRKLFRKTLTRLFGRRPHPTVTDAGALASHFAYGAAVGAPFALIPRAGLMSGALWGLAIWAGSYMGWIPAVGLMPPPSRDRPGRPAAMILAHIVFGTTLGAVRLMQR